MISRLAPYLSFRDNARKAMEFYKSVFGGKLELHTFEEYHAAPTAEENDHIMHSMLEADNGLTFMAADTPSNMEFEDGKRVSMSLSGDNEQELRRYYEKLKEGGQEIMPLGKAPWGDFFGLVTDKFGIEWMVNISPAKA
jgi:PhnB protein